MDALILTEQQSAALRAANAGSLLRLEPRRLGDGRLVLNADVLDDPYFADRSRGWAAVLVAPVAPVDDGPGADGIQSDTKTGADLGGDGLKPVQIAAGIERVTLSEAELR